MTDEKAKEILAEGNRYLQEVKLVLNHLKFKASKSPDAKKDAIEKYIRAIENLYNYSLVQEIRVEERDAALIKMDIKNHSLRIKLGELEYRYELSEKIHEAGIDVVVEEFREKAGKILMDKAKQL